MPLHFDCIEADNKTLLQQAAMTATEYLDNAITSIDQRFGNGFAKAHPELIAAFMQTAAIDLGTAVIARAVETHTRAVSDRLPV